MADSDSTNSQQLMLPLEAPPEPAVDWRAQVPTVSQLTRRIRGHLESAFVEVWVRGEISNFRKPASGHAYFILKDATAQLKLVMFRPALSKLKFALSDGLEILIHGKITVYEARGEYQMVADAAEPAGMGALQLAFEQLKARLAAEGLFRAERKRPLPFLPRRIGIVTSPTGAAIRDMLKVLGRRFPGIEVVIFPACVQGDRAPREICAAMSLAERWNREIPERRLDVLIVGRGGGSLEDLWCFNDESVARAIYGCTIPVISAVGHEIDFTISDFVADLRAPTPSAAAELVVPRRDELESRVRLHTGRLHQAMRRRLEQTKLHLGHLSSRLVDPRERARICRRQFALMQEKLFLAMRARMKLCRKRLESDIHLLHSLSPLSVIGRGYSITRRADGTLLRSVGDAKPGDRLVTRTTDGEVHSEVVPTPSAS